MRTPSLHYYYIGRPLRSALLGLSLLLPLIGCQQETGGARDYYAFEQPAGGVWKPRTTYSFDLLFPDRTTTFTGEIVLRMDSRLDRPRARMEVRLRQDETILRRDTLQVDFAVTAGDWKRPGALYHEFVLPLARPLQAPYTGLFSLEVRPLDTIPLSGVAAIGLHTAELRAE